MSRIERLSDNGLELIKRSEGFRAEAYPDPGSADGLPWTIGYGTTKGVRPGMVISRAQAEKLLADDVTEFERMVVDHCPDFTDQGQFDALVSFAYNMGPGGKGIKDGFVWLRNGNPPTIRRLHNQGDYKGAADEFPKWANPPLPGLVVRRARERDLYLGRDWRLIPDADVATARQHNAVPA